MSRLSIRRLLVIIAIVAIAIVAGIAGLDTYKQSKFAETIAASWEIAPVTSTLTIVGDINDLIICFDENGLQLPRDSPAKLVQRADAGEQNYDLDCTAGKFRVIFYGNIYTDLAAQISLSDRPFDVILDSLLLNDKSRWTTASLWVLRMQYMPIGCNVRLQHYESATKMGVISGTLETRPQTFLHVFDSSGEFSIGVLPLDPKIKTWDELANRIALATSQEDGG